MFFPIPLDITPLILIYFTDRSTNKDIWDKEATPKRN